MRLFGLVGYPLSHSFSAEWFAEKLRAEGITNVHYHNFPVKGIQEIDKLMQDTNLCGFNVTIPYKETIIGYLDEVSEDAEKIKAVNCVVKKDGKWIGHNTDWQGFRDSLENFLENEHPAALILGSGGASKAVAYALDDMGIEHLTVSRKDISLRGKNSIDYNALSSGIISEYKLIINTTPLGTWPDTEQEPPIPYDLLTPGHFLYDLIYNPGLTLFLSEGLKRGSKVKNGLEMLHRQAELSWKLFGL